MQRNGLTSGFRYGPDNQRYLQQSTDGRAIVYLDKLVEIETGGQLHMEMAHSKGQAAPQAGPSRCSRS